ncbi:MAG: putative molybdopterin-guanine dinucleotide biosynthesis protein [Acidobacteriaceae bacterium]|nr:putative molybdopterin-guanine dinucleotide biosynthesis protein [Acidobacteriaceae bacterium]
MSLLPVIGFVLAGGRSSRMGRDKALLILDGRTLVERAIAKLSAVCISVAIAGGGEELTRYARVLPDTNPGCGPLGGIVTALEGSQTEWCLFLPVDVPLLPLEFLRALTERALASSAVAVLPRVAGRLEPLCAAYRRAALPGLRQSLSEGMYKVTAAVERAGAMEVFDVADRPELFANVNTPDEFAAAERLLKDLRDAASETWVEASDS